MAKAVQDAPSAYIYVFWYSGRSESTSYASSNFTSGPETVQVRLKGAALALAGAASIDRARRLNEGPGVSSSASHAASREEIISKLTTDELREILEERRKVEEAATSNQVSQLSICA